jgi:hypothetical protein
MKIAHTNFENVEGFQNKELFSLVSDDKSNIATSQFLATCLQCECQSFHSHFTAYFLVETLKIN